MREPQEHFVDLKSLTSDALQQIIDFMYSGEMTFNFDNLIEILNAANHLQVQRPVGWVLATFKDNVSVTSNLIW